MYSIVMVAAIAVGPETPDFFFKNKGGGCYGSCYGNGCYGSCYGCNGGGWGCHGVSAYGAGCYGGCYGGGYGGGWGHKGGYGGHAFVGGGCCGGYAAPYYTGCGGYAPPAGYYAPGGPVITGYGGGGVYVPAAPVVPAPAAPPAGTEKGTGGIKVKEVLGVPEAAPHLPAGRAQVIVRVPADARLFADGQATVATGAERVFLSPEISGARDYQYTLKVEYPAGGEAETRQVTVRAGHRTVVEFTGTTTIEKVTSPVTVALPANAKLYVDGVAAAAAPGTTTFRTPELTRGKPYVYEFRAEVEKDGKTEVESRQVTFKGGEPVTVNFVAPEATRTAAR